MTTKEHTRVWRPDWPCPVRTVLSPFRHGPGDPTFRTDADGTVWRGVRTPEGPVTYAIRADASAGEVRARAWGPGAQWALDGVPRLLGADDDASVFRPAHPPIEQAWHRLRHLRVGASGLVMESLVPVIIEQKVTGQEAFAAYRRLVLRFGEPAPGPGHDRGVRIQPDAEALRRIPSWEWLRLPIDGGRSRPLQHAARVAGSLERAGRQGPEVLDRRVRTLPGIGVWTSAETRSRALGDPDAVSFGDYHVAANLTWVLTGTPGDDEQMAELLSPYAGHRYRVQRLVELSGWMRPRRGPRMAPRRHLPV